MKRKKTGLRQLMLFAGVVFLMVGNSVPMIVHASDDIKLSKGQSIYVPVYSNIYVGDREMAWNLSANLSIRNTDPSHPITILAVDYYDTEGNLVKRYLSAPKPLNPMGSAYYYLKTSDSAGGWGANFVVKWKSEKEVNEPIIECLMTGQRGSHSVSFITHGRVLAK